MPQPEPGDIFEVTTPQGLAYLQFTHAHPSYPEVVRALAGVHQRRPDELEALAAGPTRFVALYPLAAAIARGRLPAEPIGRAPVPPEFAAFPTFSSEIRDRSGATAYWWLWDGESLRYTTDLDESERALPLREVLSTETLIARLAEG